jgi:hypothetical protein
MKQYMDTRPLELTNSSLSEEVFYGTKRSTIIGVIIKIELSFIRSRLRTVLLDCHSVMRRKQKHSSRRWLTERRMPVKLQRPILLAGALRPVEDEGMVSLEVYLGGTDTLLHQPYPHKLCLIISKHPQIPQEFIFHRHYSRANMDCL